MNCGGRRRLVAWLSRRFFLGLGGDSTTYSSEHGIAIGWQSDLIFCLADQSYDGSSWSDLLSLFVEQKFSFGWRRDDFICPTDNYIILWLWHDHQASFARRRIIFRACLDGNQIFLTGGWGNLIEFFEIIFWLKIWLLLCEKLRSLDLLVLIPI